MRVRRSQQRRLLGYLRRFLRGASVTTLQTCVFLLGFVGLFVNSKIPFLMFDYVAYYPAVVPAPSPDQLRSNFTIEEIYDRLHLFKSKNAPFTSFLVCQNHTKNKATETSNPSIVTVMVTYFDPNIDITPTSRIPHAILFVTTESLQSTVENTLKEMTMNNIELCVIQDHQLPLLTGAAPSHKTFLLMEVIRLNPFNSDVFLWCSEYDPLDFSSQNLSAVFLVPTSHRFAKVAEKQAAVGGWVHPTADELYTSPTLIGGTRMAIERFHNILSNEVQPVYTQFGWPINEAALWQTSCLLREALCRYWNPKGKDWWVPPKSKHLVEKPTILHSSKKYGLDPTRYLYLRPANAGWNNQWQCLHLAATIAIRQNRTLWIDAYAYQASKKHVRKQLPFDQIFDVDALKLPVGISSPGDYPKECRVELPTVHRELPENTGRDLGVDLHPSARCVVWDCAFGNLHHLAPPSHFPQVDEILLPLLPVYRRIAHKVISEIQEQVGKRDAFSLLGVHVRRGDQKGYPLVNCSTTQYPHTEYLADDDAIYSLCSKTSFPPTKAADELSWQNYFLHLNSCDGVQCIRDYHAVFVATDNVDYVRGFNVSNLFTLSDFLPNIRKVLCKEFGCPRIKDLLFHEFLVEESILIMSAVFQPSLPSSVTDMVLHQRLEEHGFNSRDVALLRLHDDKLWDLYDYRYRFPHRGRTRKWD